MECAPRLLRLLIGNGIIESDAECCPSFSLFYDSGSRERERERGSGVGSRHEASSLSRITIAGKQKNCSVWCVLPHKQQHLK